MKLNLLLLALLFSIIISAQNPAPFSKCGDPVVDDYCWNTPVSDLCTLDGYSFSTGGYTVDNDDVEKFSNAFCGFGTGTHNDLWFKFITSTNKIHLRFENLGCQNTSNCRGVQAGIFETDCAETNSTYLNTLTCVNCVTIDFDLIYSNLVPGQAYFLMMDGCCGDICDYTIYVIDDNVSECDCYNIDNQDDLNNFVQNHSGNGIIEKDLIIGNPQPPFNGSNITNLQGLDFITKIEGNLFIGNNENLESLKGLENIKSVGGNFVMINNPKLGECKEICAFLKDGNVSEEIFIYDNLTACNDIDLITNGCTTENEDIDESSIQIYPNPVTDILHIDGINEKDAEISIYNQIGKLVQTSINKKTISLAHLGKGIYFLKMNTKGGTIFKKFLKK